jgi:hypothetical protein
MSAFSKISWGGCTPASGWEKGQVENQVGNLRDQMFRPKPRVKSLIELNAWLEDQCIAYAKRAECFRPSRLTCLGKSYRRRCTSCASVAATPISASTTRPISGQIHTPGNRTL